MRSAVQDILPASTKEALAKLGQDLATARRKRRLTMAMMVERVGVAMNTYRKIEQGDPCVALGAYAMALYVLGMEGALADLVAPRKDELGLQLDQVQLPKRVRTRKTPVAL